MTPRLACATLILATLALPMAMPSTATAGAAQSYMYGDNQVKQACRPPLKFAAGACVRRCPAGYRDTGRTCRFRSMRR